MRHVNQHVSGAGSEHLMLFELANFRVNFEGCVHLNFKCIQIIVGDISIGQASTHWLNTDDCTFWTNRKLSKKKKKKFEIIFSFQNFLIGDNRW